MFIAQLLLGTFVIAPEIVSASPLCWVSCFHNLMSISNGEHLSVASWERLRGKFFVFFTLSKSFSNTPTCDWSYARLWNSKLETIAPQNFEDNSSFYFCLASSLRCVIAFRFAVYCVRMIILKSFSNFSFYLVFWNFTILCLDVGLFSFICVLHLADFLNSEMHAFHTRKCTLFFWIISDPLFSLFSLSGTPIN